MPIDRPIYRLRDRGVIALSGDDARAWLDNLVTNDLSVLDTNRIAFAGLLSPQGKLLFEFFIHAAADATIHIETARATVADLMKRLSLYRLRAKVALADVSAEWGVDWGRIGSEPLAPPRCRDPRAPDDLWRSLAPAVGDVAVPPPGPYVAERVRLGLPEAPFDYALGETFPHEANFDRQHGVSFTKGCYIGQEVVSRMQNKSVIRKRVVRVAGSGDLSSGAEITAGDAVVGRIGSTDGHRGLAMVRLDRVVEALEGGVGLAAGAVTIDVDAAALAHYRHSVANRPVHDL